MVTKLSCDIDINETDIMEMVYMVSWQPTIHLQFFKTHVEKVQNRQIQQGSRLSLVKKIAFKFIWLLCTGELVEQVDLEFGHYTIHPTPRPCLAARNALVVFVAALIGYCLTLQPWFNGQISLIDYDHGSLPSVSVPDPTPHDCSVSNKWYVWICLLNFDIAVCYSY